MKEYKMHVDVCCPFCGRREQIIFLEPVDVNQAIKDTVPPGWGYWNEKLICGRCLKGEHNGNLL